MAGRIDIDVLSTTSSEPLKFAKISEIEKTTTVYRDDYLLLSNDTDGVEKTRSVKLCDLKAYFEEVNITMQWFVPVVNDGIISWEWASGVESVDPIDIRNMVGLVDRTNDGLMSSLDKAKLDAISLDTLSKMPTCTKHILSASRWDSTAFTQKINMIINTNNHNAVDYPAGYNQIVLDCGIRAIREESNGITFKCNTRPTSDVVVYITSTKVTT